MTQYAIATDLNRCVGCLACSAAAKALTKCRLGTFGTTLRIGPNPTKGGSGQFPDVELYFLTVQCQHCANPACVEVCPTGASHKLEDGTVQIDKSKCIGCQFCAMACPYGVRYLNEEERVVEKCTLCEQKIAQDELRRAWRSAAHALASSAISRRGSARSRRRGWCLLRAATSRTRSRARLA